MISIDRKLNTPAYRQIYESIRSDIENGTLAPQAKLPGIRELAHELGIARNTVEAAYKQLSLEGYATGKRGVGYAVEHLDFSLLGTTKETGNASAETDLKAASDLGRNPLGDDFGCTYDFSYGNRTPSALPRSLWRSLTNEALSEPNSAPAASYMDPFGLPGLRILLAEQLQKTRGVRCLPEQILLQPGTQPAIQGAVELFDREGVRVAMEDPGYSGARAVFEKLRCDIRPIPRHNDDTTFIDFLNASQAELAFVTPSNQFPLGSIMPLATRLEMIGWARRRGSYIIEDDYCCEYRYGSDPVPSMQSLDPDHVIYLGTLSKILSPAIRISYAVLPPALVARWNNVHRVEFCPVPWITQEVMRLFISKGYWDRYVRATVNLYRKRHDVLINSIDEHLGGNVKVLGSGSGLHVLMGDREKRSQNKLIELARKHDVRVYETDSYWMNKSHPMNNFVLVGFSAIEDALIPEGMKRLRQAWYD